MPTYDRRTTIDAPLEDVWTFYTRIEGLEAVTPDWVHLRVESVIGPDGDAEPDGLPAGTEIALSIRPFGVGPRQYTRSLITDRKRGERWGRFVDEMVSGPFPHWVHTHSFAAVGDRTVLWDHVEYDMPGSDVAGVGRVAVLGTPIANVGLETMFRARHRVTKAHLEGVDSPSVRRAETD